MRPQVVVIDEPFGRGDSSCEQIDIAIRVKQLVSDPAVARLDVPVLHWLSGVNEMQSDVVLGLASGRKLDHDQL